MAPPPHLDSAEHARSARPSDRGIPPPDVADPLLWALAVDVAAAHRPGPDGACTNLQCRGQRGACWALRTAHRAARQARHATGGPPQWTPPPVPAPATQPIAALPHRSGTARGRASVPATTQRFTSWFGPTPASAPPAPNASAPQPTPHRPVPFRRPPVAALVA